jgi:methyltransferase (TIGR00027 family)
MDPERPSRTAAQNALFRALEAQQRSEERVADDRLATWFLPLEFQLLVGLARIPALRSTLESVIDRRWPCVRGGVVARTRLLDDAIERALPGVQQALLLGAGYDSRAYRLPGMDAIAVFEVDHPSTQALKRRVLTHKRAQWHADVRFVPVVFGQDDPERALRTAGFLLDLPTLVLWEGVTNYLDVEAVNATFRLIARIVATDSPIFFTYVHRGMLDGSVTFEGATTTMNAVRRVGEPFSFGFAPDEVRSYLADRGFELAWDVSVADAGADFYPNKPVTLPAYYHVVEARRL